MSARCAITALVIAALAIAAALAGCRDRRASATIDAGSPQFTFEHSGCYRGCPRYLLTFHSDGTVDYEGNGDVAVRGHQRTHIEPAEFARVFALFDAIGYDSLTWDFRCEAKLVRDGAVFLTSRSRNGATHSLEHTLRDGCAPASIGVLEDAILELAKPQVMAWTHCDGRCPE